MSMSLSNSENNPKAIICPKCKQELPEDSQFCHFCGANIEAAVIFPAEKISQEIISEQSPVIHTLNHTETVEKSKKKPIIIGIVSAVAVALIVTLIILVVRNNAKVTDIYNVGVRTISFEDEFTAEYVLSAWENGAKTERSMIAIMDEYGAEQGGGQLYIITRGEFVEEIEEWSFSSKRKKGDYAIIENAYGFSLCYYSGYNLEDYNSSQLGTNNNNNVAVTWLSDYRFLYYDDFSKFVLLFELSDDNKKTVSASGTVEIRIVNDDNVTVYDKKRTFAESNFENWTYDDTVEKYLAAIYIEPNEIIAGNTEFGTVYFTVYGDNYNFEEFSISIGDLPTKPNTAPKTNNNANNNNNTNNSSNKHTCLNVYCDNEVVKSGDYCSEHKCQNGDCGYERESNSKYCSACMCGTSGCLNVKTKNGYYCVEHTCSEPKCQYNKSADEKYCSYHACDICGELRLSTSLYCAEHD